jgi:hypothetical protein
VDYRRTWAGVGFVGGQNCHSDDEMRVYFLFSSPAADSIYPRGSLMNDAG